MNVAHLLDDAATLHADRSALVLRDRSISYAQLSEQVAAIAEGLRRHRVGVGDRVALMLPNGVDFVAAYFAILRVGAVAVPLNVLLRPPEIRDRVVRASPSLFLVGGETDIARPDSVEMRRVGDLTLATRDVPLPVRRGTGDAAAILFTSGTSGAARGAVLTHGSLRAAALNAAAALGLGPADVMLGVAPFSHVLGQSTGILSTVASGGAIAVLPRFDPADTLGFMVETATTVVLGVPAMCITLCRAARGAERPLPPVRIGHIGGAPVPPEVVREFERTFHAAVREGYGLTEMSGIATTYCPGEARRAGSVGRPLGGTELRIVSFAGDPLPAGEIGEVRFRGPSVFAGYWEDEEETRAALAPEGWLATGDLGYVDDDGYLFLVDRKKELIIRGGYNVYPREVEDALRAHPDVAEAAVVGVPHEVLGEEVAAVVVLEGGSALTAESLLEFVRERVAAYKYPRLIVFVDALPKGPTGKVLKRAIDKRQLLATPAGPRP